MILRLVVYVLVFFVFQIPMLHGWVIGSIAFPFQYIGLILLIPHKMNRALLMVLAFFLGLLVDVFSNTPGVHASATVLIATIRLFWLGLVDDTDEEELDLNLTILGIGRFTLFVFPLIFIHHFILFTLENEGFRWFLMLLGKVFWSSLYSFGIILLVSWYVAPKRRRI